jgi:hypothetical protein
MIRRLALSAAAGLLAASAAVAQPMIWAVGVGGPRLGHDGTSVFGICFNFPLALYGNYIVRRGQPSQFLFNQDYGSGGPDASGDLSVLAAELDTASIPLPNWEGILTFTGYEFSWTNTAGVCTPTNPNYGEARPPVVRPFNTPQRWTPGTGWVSLGGLPRFLGSSPDDGIPAGDPRDIRFFGGTRCDANTATVGQVSGDGVWVFGSAYKTTLTRTNPCGQPGVSFGLCGDFQPYAWSTATGMLELPVSQPVGSVTARVDAVNGDGTVACGYDSGFSPDPDGGIGSTVAYLNVPVSSGVQLQPGTTYWVGVTTSGVSTSSVQWGRSSLPASSVVFAQRSTGNWSTPSSGAAGANAPAVRLTGNNGSCGVTLIDTFDPTGSTTFTSSNWNVAGGVSRAIRFTVPAGSPVSLCRLEIPLGATTGVTNVLVSIWPDSGTGTLPANGQNSLLDVAVSGPLASFNGWRATVWRRDPATNVFTRTLLDPYGYPNPGMITNTGGGMPDGAGGRFPTFIALGLTPQGSTTTFVPPAQWSTAQFTAATLTRWVYDPGQAGNAWNGWVPTNLGRPAPVLVNGVPQEAQRITPTLMSRDGNLIIGRAEFGGAGIGAQAVQTFIWSPTLNGGVPMNYDTYLATLGVPALLTPGVTMGLPMAISTDGNALLVGLTDDRDYCPAPDVESLFTGTQAVLYLNNTGAPCEAPRMIAPLNDTLDYTGIGVTGLGMAFNAFASGTWPLEYQWQKETAPNSNVWVDLVEGCNGFQNSYQWEFEGTRKNQLRIGLNLNVENHSGRYRVRVSNACGTVFSEPATVTIAVGACCFQRPGSACRECTVRTEYDCGGTFGQFGYRLGGTFAGVGTTCSPTNCPDIALGSCVNSFSTCEITCQFSCESVLLGTWTSGGTCAATVACCDPAGNCLVLTPANCVAAGGTQFASATCSPSPCPSQVPCCDVTGACTPLLADQCSAAGGTVGGSSTCAAANCPQPFACCFGDGTCTFILGTTCVATGGIVTDFTCGPSTCPQPGACCINGVCSLLLTTPCLQAGGVVNGTTCVGTTCPTPVACCNLSGACTLTLQPSCPAGQIAVGSTCNAVTCPQPIGCCSSAGVCTIVFPSQCTSPSTPGQTGASCGPTSCVTATVCCRGSTCAVLPSAQCTVPPGPVVGVSSGTAAACGITNSAAAGCCFADFNKQGGTTIDDIFIYLNAWFAASDFANIGDPGTPNIDDIFIFLNAWFAGC